VSYGWSDPNPISDPRENSRRKPLGFSSIQEAENYAKEHGVKVWAKVWSWTGVFEVYPGGRRVWRSNG
jgi:hypothetical protein